MRGALRFAPLFLLLGAAPPALPRPEQLPEIDAIRVRKGARVLELWSGGQLIHTIEHIQLGDEPTGPKRFEGDERTPEGRYVIDWGNARSAYHLSLHISYPSLSDQAYAARYGRSAGGMIMIHGQPNGTGTARIPGDWTDGCIALNNAEMDLLWQVVADGTPIDITP